MIASPGGQCPNGSCDSPANAGAPAKCMCMRPGGLDIRDLSRMAAFVSLVLGTILLIGTHGAHAQAVPPLPIPPQGTALAPAELGARLPFFRTPRSLPEGAYLQASWLEYRHPQGDIACLRYVLRRWYTLALTNVDQLEICESSGPAPRVVSYPGRIIAQELIGDGVATIYQPYLYGDLLQLRWAGASGVIVISSTLGPQTLLAVARGLIGS